MIGDIGSHGYVIFGSDFYAPIVRIAIKPGAFEVVTIVDGPISEALCDYAVYDCTGDVAFTYDEDHKVLLPNLDEGNSAIITIDYQVR